MSVVALREVAQVISGQHLVDGQHNTLGKGLGYLTGPSDFGLETPVISRWTHAPKAVCEPGDVLVTVKGAGVGKVNLAPGTIAAIGRQLMAVRSDNQRLDASYLAAFLKSKSAYFRERAVGATVPGLSRSDLEDLELPLPPLVEQRELASHLKARLVEVEAARQAAQKQVREAELLNLRLLRTAFDALVAVPVKPLGDWVLSYRNGFGKRPAAGETGPIVLRIADVSSGTIDVSKPRRGGVSAKEADTYRLLQDDLLFVRVNGAREIVGRCCVVGANLPPGTIFNDHLIRVRLKPGIDSEYARFFVGTPTARTLIEEAASTSAGQLTINQEVIAAVEIPDLSLHEQRLIVAQLKAQLAEADAIAQAARAQLAEIERLPQRLLAQAFDRSEVPA